MKTMKKGAKGSPVEALQKALNKKGAKPALKVDGKFGPKTEGAVQDFQKKMKMKADGIAGPITLVGLGLASESALMEWTIPTPGKLYKEIAQAGNSYVREKKRRDYMAERLGGAEGAKLQKTLDKLHADQHAAIKAMYAQHTQMNKAYEAFMKLRAVNGTKAEAELKSGQKCWEKIEELHMKRLDLAVEANKLTDKAREEVHARAA